MCGGTWPPLYGEPKPGRNTRFVLDGTDNLIDAPPVMTIRMGPLQGLDAAQILISWPAPLEPLYAAGSDY
jgi:hypothetical protein